MTRDEIVTKARSAIGTPFRHQGRSLRGMDCVGLLFFVAPQGVALNDVSGYPRLPNGELEEAILAHVAAGVVVPVPLKDRRAGDIVLMRFEKDDRPRHVGIIGHDDTIIHAYAVTRKVCEHRIDDAWKRRIVGAWRFTGVEQ